MSFGYIPSSGAGVAQLVEQRIRNAQVVGSTPSASSIESITYKGREPLPAFVVSKIVAIKLFWTSGDFPL